MTEYEQQVEEDNRLLRRIQTKLPELEELLEELNRRSRYEDGVYRFYHSSYKIYKLRDLTERIVEAFQSLQTDRGLNKTFLEIVKEGGQKDEGSLEERRLRKRKLLEGFFHAKYFLEMCVYYGKELKEVKYPCAAGWAAILYLFNQR